MPVLPIADSLTECLSYSATMDLQKPLKYFDLYTQDPNEDARAGISSLSSKLQLVPKSTKHSSRERRRNRSIQNKPSVEGKSPKNAQTSIAIFDTRSEVVPLTVEALVRHTTSLPAQDSPPHWKTQEPVHSLHVSTSNAVLAALPSKQLTPDTNVPNKPRGTLPAKLAVPAPFDLFAGPASPAPAEAVAGLAVSGTRESLQVDTSTKSETSIALTQIGSPKQQLVRPRDVCDSIHIGGNIASSNQKKVIVASDTAASIDSEVIPTIDDIIRQHDRSRPRIGASISASSPPVPSIPAKFRCGSHKILSIDDIVSKHQPTQLHPRKVGHSAGPTLPSTSRPRSRTTTEDSAISQSRSSIDSITGEILQSIQQQSCDRSPQTLYHARSQPSFSTPVTGQNRHRLPGSCSDSPSDCLSNASLMPSDDSRSPSSTPTTNEEITRYLRSARLTRLLTLRRPPNHHLVVSLADVGSEDGHPVVIYLGLGSVRYLVALYDDLAASLGLRLICIDRWGLGKTGEVSDSRRGFREWSYVVEEVLDQLGIGKFSMIAHSAGTPYALASSIRLDSRLHGTIQLLAPWVGSAAESPANAYKWLKFVPSSLIKTAQAAEWKMQGWRLGKNPKVQAKGVGFDPRAPLSSESAATSPIFSTFHADITQQEDEEACRHPTYRTSPSVISSERDISFEDAADTTFLSTPTQSRSRKTSADTPAGHCFEPRADSVPTRLVRKTSTTLKATPIRGASIRSQTNIPKNTVKLDLGTALMRASHAESLKGGTSDLLAILQKTGKVLELSYSDISHPVRVWHGLKDDKISLQSVLSLETLIPHCKVNVIPGADHSLMTNVVVFVQVLQAIAGEWEISSRL